jgi:hypothetical protein
LTPGTPCVDCNASISKRKFAVATRRTKKSLKNRPKHIQKRALRTRRRKAKQAASHKRGLNRNRARRKRKSGGGKLRIGR